MKLVGNLLKMQTDYAKPVQYYLNIEQQKIHMNDLLGRRLHIKFLNQINCISCDAITNKSFHQGYCYACFTTLPQTDLGILHPEKDLSHEGISRDMNWAKENSLKPHIVYLALTSQLKVGVTRLSELPTRWIDQGASHAIRFAKTPYRKLAGDIEVFLKNYVADKTMWKQMILAPRPAIDLLSEKQKLIDLLPEEFQQFISLNNQILEIVYPGHFEFDNIHQHTLDDKNAELSGELVAIRGQYLVFKQGFTFNVRRHNGYLIELEID
jgi:hypothetical protein